MFRTFALTTLTAATFIYAAQAQSGDVRQYHESDRVDPRDVARILGAEPQSQPRMLMRSIRLKDEVPSAKASDEVPATASRPQLEQYVAKETATRTDLPQARPSALSLPVQFAFDSASILPQARRQLDALAEGFKLLPASRTVVIEGHTDAAGSDVYNLQLSNRRAIAVKEYLVTVHGIDGSRLKTRGFGEDQPINERDPYASENRRVQFRGS
jgi:outer membrane protein OmpA-like peptidoglycan-associated protein